MEKVVSSKQLELEMETEEERRTRQENDAATKQLRLTVEIHYNTYQSNNSRIGS